MKETYRGKEEREEINVEKIEREKERGISSSAGKWMNDTRVSTNHTTSKLFSLVPSSCERGYTSYSIYLLTSYNPTGYHAVVNAITTLQLYNVRKVNGPQDNSKCTKARFGFSILLVRTRIT